MTSAPVRSLDEIRADFEKNALPDDDAAIGHQRIARAIEQLTADNDDVALPDRWNVLDCRWRLKKAERQRGKPPE